MNWIHGQTDCNTVYRWRHKARTAANSWSIGLWSTSFKSIWNEAEMLGGWKKSSAVQGPEISAAIQKHWHFLPIWIHVETSCWPVNSPHVSNKRFKDRRYNCRSHSQQPWVIVFQSNCVQSNGWLHRSRCGISERVCFRIFCFFFSSFLLETLFLFSLFLGEDKQLVLRIKDWSIFFFCFVG